MTLISSVSGIRGTVGGEPAKNLTPIDVVLFTSSFAFLIQSKYDFDCSLIVGRAVSYTHLTLPTTRCG